MSRFITKRIVPLAIALVMAMLVVLAPVPCTDAADHAEATLMLKRQHPDGLAGPHPFAIAHHLLGRWVHHRNPLDQ